VGRQAPPTRPAGRDARSPREEEGGKRELLRSSGTTPCHRSAPRSALACSFLRETVYQYTLTSLAAVPWPKSLRQVPVMVFPSGETIRSW
jgi:hypothetical protein